MPAEIELKLAIDRAAVPRIAELVRHPAVVAARRGRMHAKRVVSTYYDTRDFALAAAGVALRVRRDGARWVQTVKGPPVAAAGGGLHAHEEHEWRLAQPRLDAARLALTPWRKLFAKTLARGVFALFVTDVVRRTVPLAFGDGTTATLAIDVGTIRTKRAPVRRVPVAELEIEIGHGSAAPAYALALTLVDDWPLSVGTATKAARGYALVRGEPDGWHRPVHAGYAAFGQEDSAESALRAIALECLQQIAANARGLVADADPEWVHQMRVGTRRLRSCLSLIQSIADTERVASVVAETRWLAGILGAARDWDVLAAETLPPLAAALGHDPAVAAGLGRLSKRIGAKRDAARDAAREAVRSLRFECLLLATGALCAASAFGAREPALFSAGAFATKLLAQRHRKLIDRGAALAGGTPEERHAVRIAAKKLRYAAEFFSPANPRRRNREYLRALSRLQDALGRWNDAVTAARLAAELADVADHATAGAVRGWAAAQAAALEPVIAHAWNRFEQADPFWTRA